MQTDATPLKWILDPKLRWLWHVLFWILMYLDEFLSIFGITEGYEAEAQWFMIASLLLDIILVYLNFYVLIPRFLLKNRFWTYAGLTLLGIILVNGFNMFADPYFECPECTIQDRISEFILGTFLPTLTLLGTAIAIKLFKMLLQKEIKLQEVENDKLQTELNFLKDQVNPHFLFNALNNIYVQSRKRPTEASESILLLSDLMRYQLYDCSKEKVYLSNEIDYLKNYLELDKMRKSKATIEFNVMGTVNGKMVAPFLFSPFIENAVKHGMSMDNESTIQISFDITEDQIHFRSQNSKVKSTTPGKVGGIGLANVKRRLKLLYPDKHSIAIRDEEEQFTVDLKLLLGK